MFIEFVLNYAINLYLVANSLLNLDKTSDFSCYKKSEKNKTRYKVRSLYVTAIVSSILKCNMLHMRKYHITRSVI